MEDRFICHYLLLFNGTTSLMFSCYNPTPTCILLLNGPTPTAAWTHSSLNVHSVHPQCTVIPPPVNLNSTPPPPKKIDLKLIRVLIWNHCCCTAPDKLSWYCCKYYHFLVISISGKCSQVGHQDTNRHLVLKIKRATFPYMYVPVQKMFSNV